MGAAQWLHRPVSGVRLDHLSRLLQAGRQPLPGLLMFWFALGLYLAFNAALLALPAALAAWDRYQARRQDERESADERDATYARFLRGDLMTREQWQALERVCQSPLLPDCSDISRPLSVRKRP